MADSPRHVTSLTDDQLDAIACAVPPDESPEMMPRDQRIAFGRQVVENLAAIGYVLMPGRTHGVSGG